MLNHWSGPNNPIGFDVKKLLINLVRLAISLAIIVYVVRDVLQSNPDLFQQLADQPKHWPLLATAWVLILSAVLLTFVRWYFLIRALDLPFRLRDTFRLGFVGYLLNFVSLGAVGGDLFKAVFIAHEHKGRRTAAVSTIFVDRLAGLVGLLMLASGALLFTDVSQFDVEIQYLAKATLVATAFATAALMTLMFRCGEGPLVERLCCIPRLGGLFRSIYEAAHQYREHRMVLVAAVLMRLFIHSLNVFAFFCIAHALPGTAPSLAVHFFIIPIGLVSSALPLPMEALGAFEWVLQSLYQQVGAASAAGQGLLIALAYRVIRILVAVIGVGFYLTNRAEVSELLHEEEELADEPLGIAGERC